MKVLSELHLMRRIFAQKMKRVQYFMFLVVHFFLPSQVCSTGISDTRYYLSQITIKHIRTLLSHKLIRLCVGVDGK